MKAKLVRGSFTRNSAAESKTRRAKSKAKKPSAPTTRSKAKTVPKIPISKKKAVKNAKKNGVKKTATGTNKKKPTLKRVIKVEKQTGRQAKQKIAKKQPDVLPPIKCSAPDKKLNPRPHVTLYEKNPFFECKTPQSAFVSVSNYSKSAIRAVLTDDEPLLKKLIADKENVHSVHVKQSIDCHMDALTYAMTQNKPKMVKLLVDDLKNPLNNRVKVTPSLLQKQSTGQYNFRTLGRAVKSIQMSRGGREGTNAFLKDQNEFTDGGSWIPLIETAIRYGVEIQTLRHIVADGTFGQNSTHLSNSVYLAARAGKYQLAGQLIRDYAAGNFNELAQQVLLNKNEALKPFKAVSVKKKGHRNKDVTPLHLACINPNVKYLKELLAVDSDLQCKDSDDYKLIHYAAVCESSAALRHLLQCGASPFDVTKRACQTALHLACETGRAENIAILCDAAIKQSSTSAKGDNGADGGVRGSSTYIRQKTRTGGCLSAVHLAARRGHVTALRALLKHGGSEVGGDKNRCGASGYSMTPLTIAAQHGHLDVVRVLHDEACGSLDGRDKLKRTALMLCAMNGHAHVASYLLREGVDADAADSSGNSAAHYAAAYGWYFVLELLIEAGANLCKSNDWLLTPLSVAYMKGHMGLVNLILQQPNVDINCQDSSGMTLVALTISSGIDETTLDQLSYLLYQKKADVNLSDAQGSNPFHLLACSTILDPLDQKTEDELAKFQADLILGVAQILMKVGCNPNKINDDLHTPLSLSVQNGRLDLALYLVVNTEASLEPLLPVFVNVPKISDSIGAKVQLFHDLAKNANKNVALQLFNVLASKFREGCVYFLRSVDKSGFTPFLACCQHYKAQLCFEDQENCRGFIVALIKILPGVIFQKVVAKNGEIDQNQTEPDAPISEENSRNSESRSDNESADLDQDQNDNEKTDEPASGEIFTTIEADLTQVDIVDPPNPSICRDSALHLLIGAKEVDPADQSNVREKPGAKPRLLYELLDQYRKERRKRMLDQEVVLFLEYLDNVGKSALFKAASENDFDSAKLLIEFGADLNFLYKKPVENGKQVDPLATPNKVSILSAAINSSNVELVKLLLSRGADVNARDAAGRSPLHYASSATAAPGLVRLLVDAGAKTSAFDALGRTPLHCACCANAGGADDDVDALEALLDAGADPYVRDNAGRLPMHYVFLKSSKPHDSSFLDPVAIVTILHRFMAGNLWDYSKPDKQGQTTLHLAAQRGSNICCIVIISFCDSSPGLLNLNHQDCNGNTAFGLSLQFGHYACALSLLQRGCKWSQPVTLKRHGGIDRENFEKINQWRWLPLRATYVGTTTTDCATLVVRHNWSGLLYLMTQQSDVDVVEAFKLLISVALREKKYNLAQTLIRQFNTNSIQKTSPLAVYFLRILAETAVDDSTSPVVGVAESLRKKFDVKFAFDGDEDVEQKMGVVLEAARRRNFTLVTYFESKMNALFRDFKRKIDGHTILTSFLHDNKPWTKSDLDWLENFAKRHTLFFNVLAAYPLPLDWTDSTITGHESACKMIKMTPLIRAIHGGNFDLVKFMLKSGLSDVNLADFDGRTPLMHAITINSTDLIRLLMNFNYEIPKIDHESFLEAETLNGNPEISTEISREDSSHSRSTRNVRALNVGVKRRNGPSEGAAPSASNKRRAMLGGCASSKFQKTSAVDLTARDAKNWDAFDYLTCPLHTCGAWQNTEILRLLLQNGARPFNPDRVGLFAAKTGQRTLLDEWRLLDAGLPNNFVAQDALFWTNNDTLAAKKLYGTFTDECANVETHATEFWRQWHNGQMTESVENSFKKVEDVLALENFSLRPKNLDLLKCGLPESLHALVKDMADLENLRRSALSSFRCGRSNFPLIVTSLKKENIFEAQNLLIQLSESIQQLAKARSELSCAVSDDRDSLVERCILAMERQCTLSCQFYRLLPLKGFDNSDVKLIDDEASIRRYASTIDGLMNYERACSVLCAAYLQATDAGIHPLDYAFRSLGCQILPTSPDDPTTQHILHYVHNTRPRGVHVLSIYKIHNPQLDAQFLGHLVAKKSTNHRLLWHGTGADNLLGVLTYGLAPAPFHADNSGSCLGRGIYTADTFSKSVSYCKPSGSGTLYMLLCEVALGNCLQVCDVRDYVENGGLKGGVYDSVQGVGTKQPDPAYNLTLPTGSTIPLGRLVHTRRTKELQFICFQNSEFVVYDPRRIIVRYLIAFKRK